MEMKAFGDLTLPGGLNLAQGAAKLCYDRGVTTVAIDGRLELPLVGEMSVIGHLQNKNNQTAYSLESNVTSLSLFNDIVGFDGRLLLSKGAANAPSKRVAPVRRRISNPPGHSMWPIVAPPSCTKAQLSVICPSARL